jgi:hypothetical protein
VPEGVGARSAPAWIASGLRHRAEGRRALAVADFRAALRLAPDDPDVWNALGHGLLTEGAFEEAEAWLGRVAAALPDNPRALNNHAGALRRLGALDRALAIYDRALRLPDAPPGARWSRAFALLLSGDYARGWPEAEWRYRRPGVQAPAWAAAQWDGRSLRSGTLLVRAEQGIGDTLQFSRFLALARERVGRLVLQVGVELHPLLADLPGVDELIGKADPEPFVQARALLMSLPVCLGWRDAGPWVGPSLRADPARAQSLRAQLRGSDRRPLRVGLIWQGNPAFEEDHLRSPPLAAFSPLFGVPGLRLFSLQQRHGLDQLEALGPALGSASGITEIGPDLDAGAPFVGTAAAMAALDLVISSDTASAHLAGALGLQAWVVLPFAPDWRWGLGADTTPWYPKLRLFRQPRPGDWDGLFNELRAALLQMILERSTALEEGREAG